MEVSQSPEEYFRQHAAAELLRTGAEDQSDDAKGKYKSWSEIDDVSDAGDDATVAKKKRILRYGRKRLSEMRGRFDSAKARLFEEKQLQLDAEQEQLRNGSHPRYREFIAQVDACWAERLARIEFQLQCGHELAQRNFAVSRQMAQTTLITRRGELRQGMIHNRKKRLWGLTDDVRSLERVSEVISAIAHPLSNHAATDTPVKAVAAPRESDHLLVKPETRLLKVDENADVSAICGIPALLNHPEPERSNAIAAAATESPTTVAAEYTQTADAQTTAGYVHGESAAYHRTGSSAVAVPAPMNDRAHPDPSSSGAAYHYPNPPAHYNPEEQQMQTNGIAPAHATNGYGYPTQYKGDGHQAYTGAASAAAMDHHRHSSSQSRVAELVHSSADVANNVSAYYGSQVPAPSATPLSVAAHQQAAAGMKRETMSEYIDTPTKRQRVVQPSSTWPPSGAEHGAHPHAQQQQQQPHPRDGQAWAATNGHGADPGTAMPPVYGYGRQTYSYGGGHPQDPQPQQPQMVEQYRQGTATPYYGPSKYDYAYYQQQQQQQHQQVAPPAATYATGAGIQTRPPPHYQQGSDGVYYPQQKPQARAAYPSGYHANGNSYSGLDAGITMPPPTSPGQYAGHYSQPQNQEVWNGYYQQQQHQHQQQQPPPQQQQHFQQRPVAAPLGGRDVYEHGGYYATVATPTQQREVAAGGDGYPYPAAPSLAHFK
ncbi:hypothetical protein GGF46_001999 [Coemansia sp. RSA 552]|nr:hypothetical protein GGF46_001999 [Coemansia sp. RSA 552]